MRIGGRNFYDVDFNGDVDSYPEEGLERVGVAGNDLESQLLNNNWGSKDTLSRIVTFTKLEQPLRNVLYSFRATRTRFESYQFKPLIKFLESPNQRLLIADEVGLGKTIEAGYILRELQARHPSSFRRVLVVCPASLRDKWRSEMERRFEQSFEIFEAEDVRRKLIGEGQRLGDRSAFHAICSMQTLRGRRKPRLVNGRANFHADWEDDPKAKRTLLDDFEAGCPPLDLVIVDEAHHMRNPEAQTHRLGQVLSEKADAMILMTATPIHRHGEDLFRLLNILDPQEFDHFETFLTRTRVNEHIIHAERALRQDRPADFSACRQHLERAGFASGLRQLNRSLYGEILEKLGQYDPSRREHIIDLQYDLNQLNLLAHAVTRTRKRDVQEDRPIRTPFLMKIDWTPQEREFYDEITAFCHKAYTLYKGDTAARFAVSNLQRQMASCIPAMVERYGAGDEAVDDDTPLETNLELEDLLRADYSVLRDPEFKAKLRSAARSLKGIDRKFDAFAGQLRKKDEQASGRKVVVFSFFKKTLAYLERRLKELGVSCLLISGDVPSKPNDPDNDERGKRVRRFHEDPTVRVLLSSEVGSEGLDFHMAAYTMVNYDLPWNPMVVEQRIGRLDRYGQPSKVIRIFNFSMSETIEDRVLELLYERIRIFKNTIGDLEPIIGEEIAKIEKFMMSSDLSDSQKEAMVEQCLDAVEQKRLTQERFEQESAQWVSQDEYFMDHVKEIVDRKRFLSPEELRVFVGEFFDKHRVAWRATESRGVFEFTWSKGLSDLVRHHLGINELKEVTFLNWAYGRKVQFAFDSEVAYENPRLELLSARHPLLRVIHDFYKQNRDFLHPVSRIRVQCDNVPAGDYLYRLYLLTQAGAVRSGRYLEAVFISLDGHVLLEDLCEPLLHAMATAGETWDPPPIVQPERLTELRAGADEELVRRRELRVQELARINEIYVERRLASIRATYDAKHRKMADRLEQAQIKGQSKQYTNMVEGSIRNIDRDFEMKNAQLQEQRSVDIAFRRVAAGIVRVNA